MRLTQILLFIWYSNGSSIWSTNKNTYCAFLQNEFQQRELRFSLRKVILVERRNTTLRATITICFILAKVSILHGSSPYTQEVRWQPLPVQPLPMTTTTIWHPLPVTIIIYQMTTITTDNHYRPPLPGFIEQENHYQPPLPHDNNYHMTIIGYVFLQTFPINLSKAKQLVSEFTY